MIEYTICTRYIFPFIVGWVGIGRDERHKLVAKRNMEKD